MSFHRDFSPERLPNETKPCVTGISSTEWHRKRGQKHRTQGHIQGTSRAFSSVAAAWGNRMRLKITAHKLEQTAK